MHCSDCGEKMSDGFCINCDEEHFIADQYRDLGESVPLGIAATEQEQMRKREN
jgi:hypothetical protein